MVAQLAGRQHGVATAAQLAQAGLTRRDIAYRVSIGRLHRVHRGVYAVGHGGLSREGRWMAAVLAAGEGAVLSHLPAATLWEAWRRPLRGIDVIAPGKHRAQTGFRIHRARLLHAHDVTRRDGIPVTSMARTLVDLTDVLDAYQMANVIHEAAFRKRFDPRATREAMKRAHGRRTSVLAAALRAHERGSAGTRSALEDRFLALARSAGRPEPVVNTRLGRFEVDFRWGRLCVEIDGDGHDRPRTRRDDEARDDALHAAGYEVLRFTAREVDERPGAVAERLGR